MGDHAQAGGGLSLAPAEDAAIAAGRLLFARPCRFVAGAGDAVLPQEGLPEIAFAGRSNVGKSSLVNALTGRRALARVSHTPGRTRQLNFFEYTDRLVLVDLPGYGYAAAAKAAIADWTRLTRSYLRSRPSLRRVCLLVDSRHGLKDADRPLMQLCDEAGVSFQIVLTKADKLPAAERDSTVAAIAGAASRYRAAHPEVHLTSTRSGAGIAALRAALAMLAAAEPSRPTSQPPLSPGCPTR